MWLVRSLILVSCLALAVPVSGQGAPLAIRMKTGDTVRYLVENQIETDVESMGIRFLTLIELNQEIELVAREIPDAGPIKLDLRMQRVWGAITTPILVAEFDSLDPKDSYPVAIDSKVRQLLLLSGKTLEVVVQRNGRVASLKGYAEIYAGTPLFELLKKDGELLTNASYQEEVQLLFAPLPSLPLAEGAAWNSAYSFSVFERSFLLEPRCEMRELTKASAQWSFSALAEGEKGTVPAAVPAGASKEEPLTAAGLLAGTKIRSASFQGVSTVSLTDGLLEHQTAERVVGADVPNPLGGPKPIPTVVTQRIELRRIRVPSQTAK
ncbi:MAG: hypothetical protein HOP15_06180 [Planctomycetes bacterium]|nr:hypothetical protein [Planctomycetota bacterium]